LRSSRARALAARSGAALPLPLRVQVGRYRPQDQLLDGAAFPMSARGELFEKRSWQLEPETMIGGHNLGRLTRAKRRLGNLEKNRTLARMAKSGRIYVSQSVSFPPDLLSEAKKRAGNVGLPFSRYVQKCIERDLIERGAIIFDEPGDRSRLVAEGGPSARPRRSRGRN
jgi:hypothetical protein